MFVFGGYRILASFPAGVSHSLWSWLPLPATEVGPAAIPAILYALARRPKYRMAAGSALAMLGVLAVWPMHMERPYRTGGTAMVSWFGAAFFLEEKLRIAT